MPKCVHNEEFSAKLVSMFQREHLYRAHNGFPAEIAAVEGMFPWEHWGQKMFV
jgi:hypothetical protein